MRIMNSRSNYFLFYDVDIILLLGKSVLVFGVLLYVFFTLQGIAYAENSGKMISVNFKDTDIRDVFARLEPVCGKQYILDNKCQGKVSLSLKKVTCDEVVDKIVEMKNLRAVEDGSLVLIYPQTKPIVEKRPAIKPKKKAEKKARKVSGDEKKYYAGVYGAYNIESLDEGQTQDKFTGYIEVDFDSAISLQFRGGYMFNDNVSFEAIMEYLLPFEASFDNGDDELDVRNMSINAKWVFAGFPRYKPYVVIGAGYLNAHEEISYGGAKSETSDWGLSKRCGAGIDIYIDSNISMGIEGSYVAGSGAVDHISYMTIAVGASYHF